MPRLPISGADIGTWGDILNDFLSQAHTSDGEIKDASVTLSKLATSSTPATGQVLAYDGTGLSWATPSGSGPVPDASTTTKGLVQLAGDLSGTASSPTVPGLSSRQPLDSDLTAIAALTPTDDDIIQRKSGAWTNRSPAQFKIDLALTKTDVGLGNVDNTSDANKPVSSAVTVALNSKADKSTTITGVNSVTGGGDLSADRSLALVNDSATPGNSKYYGTNGSGTRGYFDLPSSSTTWGSITGTLSSQSDLNTALNGKVDKSTLTTKGDLYAATGSGVVTRLAAGADGQVLEANSATSTGLNWTSNTGADTFHVVGLAADGTTDDGPVIQAVLDDIRDEATIHSYEVVVEAPPDGIIYINSTVQIESDNTSMRFGSPVVFGPNGRMRVQGELAETPLINKPFLTADSLTGATTLTLNNVAPFAIDSYILIRGARDATGDPVQDQKEYHTVASIAGNVLTLTEPLENDYLAFNPNPDAPPGTSHESQVTRVLSTLATAIPTRGDLVLTVADTSIFAVGDYVQVQDRSHTTKPDGSPETSNYKHREIAEIKQIISSTQLRLSHALHHTYSLSDGTRVAQIWPVKHSTIRDVNVTWSAMSVVGVAFEIRFGVQCSMINCFVSGDATGTKSWKNQAFRQTDSYFCQVSQCYAANPASTSSGQGYGATLYGSTYCQVRDCRFSATRHAVLLFNGASGNTVSGCVSEDCCISDYDFHGAECVDNLISGCIAIGGDSAADDGSVNKSACRVGNTAHVDGDFHNVFTDMQIINYKGSAFEVVPTSANNTFRDSRVNGAETGIRLVSLSANTALVTSDTFVENVDFADITTALTNVNGDATTTMVRGLTIENCRFIRSVTALSIQNAQRVRLRRNSWYDPAAPAVTYAITANNVTGFSAKSNDISSFVRGVKLTTCPSARVTGNTMHDLTETTVYEDAGGNTGALFARNDIYGFTPITSVSGTGPSTGGVIDIGVLYQPDTPLRHGYLEWSFDPTISSSGNGSTITNGTVSLVKIPAQTGGLVSNIIVTIGTIGTSLVSGQNFAGIYDNTGALIASTADQTTAWGSTGLITMALTAPVTIQAGRDYFVALLANGGGTATAFVTASGGSVTSANAGLSNATRRFATNGTGTTLPGSLTLSSNSGTNARPFWVALS